MKHKASLQRPDLFNPFLALLFPIFVAIFTIIGVGDNFKMTANIYAYQPKSVMNYIKDYISLMMYILSIS